MGNLRIVTKNELRTRQKLSQEELALFDQFKAFLAKLDNKSAGIYEFSKDEDHEKSRKLLKKAASALEIRIRIKEENASLVFYRKIPRSEGG